jgi:hypothetical protein
VYPFQNVDNLIGQPPQISYSTTAYADVLLASGPKLVLNLKSTKPPNKYVLIIIEDKEVFNLYARNMCLDGPLHLQVNASAGSEIRFVIMKLNHPLTLDKVSSLSGGIEFKPEMCPIKATIMVESDGLRLLECAPPILSSKRLPKQLQDFLDTEYDLALLNQYSDPRLSLGILEFIRLMTSGNPELELRELAMQLSLQIHGRVRRLVNEDLTCLIPNSSLEKHQADIIEFIEKECVLLNFSAPERSLARVIDRVKVRAENLWEEFQKFEVRLMTSLVRCIHPVLIQIITEIASTHTTLEHHTRRRSERILQDAASAGQMEKICLHLR